MASPDTHAQMREKEKERGKGLEGMDVDRSLTWETVEAFSSVLRYRGEEKGGGRGTGLRRVMGEKGLPGDLLRAENSVAEAVRGVSLLHCRRGPLFWRPSRVEGGKGGPFFRRKGLFGGGRSLKGQRGRVLRKRGKERRREFLVVEKA